MRLYLLLAALAFGPLVFSASPPPFVISGLSDTSITENTQYTSEMPVLDGNVSGAATYSLLTTIDPFSDLSDLPLFAGKNLVQILLMIYQDDSEFFTVNSNGIVSLNNPADYENPQDSNTNNVYQITLVATDDEGHRNTVSWNLTIIDQPPQSFALSGINSASVYENSSYSSHTPTINGGAIGTLTYSINGNDAQLFSVNSSTGVVNLPVQNFESPADSNGDNIYEVTLNATDSDNNSASLSWTVTVLNQPPLNFSINPITASVNEHYDYLSPAPAISGAFRNPLHFALSGDDASLFTLTSGGKVFLSAQNFSLPNDLNQDNIYVATLTATDNDDNTASTTITVTVIDTPFDPDIDSDADGVINMVENAEGTDPFNTSSYKDTDRDGTPDALETDADNDGIVNDADDLGIDPYGDNDGDFVPNYLDKTDRGDGLAATCSDYNTDSICDYQFALDPWFDIDQDSKANHADIDSDQDLLPDILEGTLDSDNDTLPNFLDKDSDGDAIPDIIESGTYGMDGNLDGIADIFEPSLTAGLDANGDGIDDAVRARDSDTDSTPDYLDSDSDNDRLPDTLEGTGSTDTDHDGIDDRFDVSNTGGNDFNLDGINDSLPMLDTNGDSEPDYLDIDSDGDGIGDTVESGASGIDTNLNNIDDRFEASLSAGIDSNLDGLIENGFLNSDNDNAFDYQDLDSDNDTLPDLMEAGGIDVNEDALNDSSTLLPLPLPNTDNDNSPNYRDLDSNGMDMDIAATPSAGFDTNADGMVEITDDPDHDGIDSSVDNAPSQYGLTPIDSDNDGISDNTDPDDDNDNISDRQEGDVDSDNDGIANRFDLDSDNDGTSDLVESGTPAKVGDNIHNGIDDAVDIIATGGTDNNNDGVDDRYQAVDSDNDGTPDFLDTDSDNDGISDNAETSNTLPLHVDSDLDGIDNAYDINSQVGDDLNNDGINDSIVPIINSDHDSRPNYKDADSDNDHIADKLEGTLDTDNDGINNRLDGDSDNDSISDLLESGAPAAIGDVNTNGIDDSIDSLLTGAADINGDGIDDRYTPRDTDKDGIANYLDDDSDDDTLSDNFETSGLALLATDQDQDGIDDRFDMDFSSGSDANGDGIDDVLVPIIDTDDDGLPNYLDKDSDNDGFADNVENEDSNHDGINDRLQPEGKVKASSGGGSTNPFLLFGLLLVALLRKPKKLAAFFLVSSLAFTSLHTRAEEEYVCRDYQLKPSGGKAFAPCFYVGAGLGISKTDADTADTSWQVKDNNSNGFNLYGGWQFSHRFFAELMISDLGKATFDNRHTLVTQEETVSYKAYSAFAGYYLPVDLLWGDNVPVKFFIKAGVSQLQNRSSSKLLQLHADSHTIAATGAGVEWNITPRWMLRGEINTFTSEAHYTGISAGYWFGGSTYRYSLTPPPALAKPAEEAKTEEVPAITAEAPVAVEKPVEQPLPVPVPVIISDTDLDGVVDEKDACPDTPAKARVDLQGCAVYKGYIQSLYGAFNSTDLTYPSYAQLDTIILLLKNFPDTRIEIQAHTDDAGSVQVNKELSEDRAEVVKAYLVSKGISAQRIKTRGYGETTPTADNKTPEGRSKNRRIDFVIEQPK